MSVHWGERLGRILGCAMLWGLLAARPPAFGADAAAGVNSAAEVADAEPAALLVLGQHVFQLCTTCHTTGQTGRTKIGPNLYGVVGSKAGSKSDFRYSDAMKASGVVWSATTLDEFLTDPQRFIPGNKMVFSGIPKESERKALIVYLRKETGG